MLKKITLSLLCGLLFLPASLAMAEDGSKVLVTAGDESLTQAEFDQMLGGSPPEIKAMLASQPGILNNFLNRWADLSLLSQAAKRQGVDKDPTVQLKIEELTTRVLAGWLPENAFAYARNNPLRYIDPLGLRAKRPASRSWSHPERSGQYWQGHWRAFP